MLEIGRQFRSVSGKKFRVSGNKIDGEPVEFGNPDHIDKFRALNSESKGYPVYLPLSDYFHADQEFLNIKGYGRRILQIKEEVIEYLTISPEKEYQPKKIKLKTFYRWVKKYHHEYIKLFESNYLED